jgi:hypothetical protein
MKHNRSVGMRSRRRHVAFSYLFAVVALAPLLGAQSGTASPFRSIDGSGNNPLHADWGRTLTPLLRRTTCAYGDGLDLPSGANRPSARAISNVVAAQTSSRMNERYATDFLWQWGQFLDHDLSLTEAASPPEAFPVSVPSGDPWFDPGHTGIATMDMSRSDYESDAARVRQQRNSITAFIDASQVYGSDPVRAAVLRGPQGRLRTSAGNLLPWNDTGLPNAPSPSLPGYFLAGDVRANEQIGLTAMHTLFVREHNSIVAALLPMGLPDDLNYEVARALVAAEIQAITYDEFLPVLLGPNALPPYTGYRPNVDPQIANEFSTVAFRVGHTMLSPTLLRLGANGQQIAGGHVPLRSAFFTPAWIVSDGIDPILRGLAGQRAQEVDPYVVDDVRNFLFGAPGSGGFDLASLNIQRGRDHGLPGYARMRRQLGLARVHHFAAISSDPIIRSRLATAYASVDDIDAWVGGLAEDHVPGAMVGPLFRRILVDQFERLRAGDRYWYERYLPPVLVAWVHNQRLSTIIRRNTGIGAELQGNAFVVPGH